MENTPKSLLLSANELTASAMAAGITNDTLLHNALETAEYVRYVVELANSGKLDEALYHLRLHTPEGTAEKKQKAA